MQSRCLARENEYFESTPVFCEESSTREESEMEAASFVEFMISRGFDFDRKNKKGQTALHLAATDRRLQHILLVLLEHASDIDFTSEDNRTLLHLVLANGRLDPGECKITYTSRRVWIVKFLIDRGVPVETVNESGRTALYTAISLKEDMSIIQAIGDRLLEVCQDSDFASRLFLELIGTCLWWDNSAVDYFFKMLRALIAKGADVNARNECGRSPINYAVECKAVGSPLIEVLLGEGCDVNSKELGWPLLHWCVYHDNVSVVRPLVESGCDVNAKDESGNSALHVAVGHPRNAAVVRLLIELGALVNCKNEHRETPLHLAVKNWDGKETRMAELLLDNGANLNSKDAVGRTVLSYAASERDMTMLKFLLRRGAYVNARDRDGKLALGWALLDERLANVKELLKYSTNVNEDRVHSLMSSEFSSGTTAFIEQHCIKLKAAKLHASEGYELRYEDDSEHQKHHEECLKEVETLKNTFIDSRTSLYDFLRKNVNSRCTYIHNEKLIALVDSSALEDTFPQYAVIISASYRDAEAKKLLLKSAKEAWLALTEMHLPDICLELILDYLTGTDLIAMADVDESKG